MPLDVGSFEKIRSFVKEFKAKNCPLHILVNNAGETSSLERSIVCESAGAYGKWVTSQ